MSSTVDIIRQSLARQEHIAARRGKCLGRQTRGKNAETAILIVAAGKGERAGTSLPKQYESLAGQPILRRSVRAFAALFPNEKWPVQVVIGPGQEALAAAALAGLALPPLSPAGRHAGIGSAGA